MTFELFSLDIHKHAESYINILCFGGKWKTRSLLYIQWSSAFLINGYGKILRSNKKITRLRIMFIQFI